MGKFFHIAWPTQEAETDVPVGASAFWGAFAQGLSAPSMLFCLPQPYSTGAISTPAQSFGIVGTYLSAAIPVVFYGGQETDDAKGDKKAAREPA